tara:strand:- start:2171 stop:2419 length:249 start_codon:yes stop_codon:yes gene_type:complete
MIDIYDQTGEMELNELEDKLANYQNVLLNSCNIMDEMWKYHPANEKFINPIREYDNIKSSIEKIEREISNVELKILHLKSSI